MEFPALMSSPNEQAIMKWDVVLPFNLIKEGFEGWSGLHSEISTIKVRPLDYRLPQWKGSVRVCTKPS